MMSSFWRKYIICYICICHLSEENTLYYMLPIIVMGLMWNNLFFAELDVLRWFFIDTWEVFIKEPMPLTARSQTRYATMGWSEFWRSIHYFKLIYTSSLSRGSVPSSYARGQRFEPWRRQYFKLLLDPGDFHSNPSRLLSFNKSETVLWTIAKIILLFLL